MLGCPCHSDYKWGRLSTACTFPLATCCRAVKVLIDKEAMANAGPKEALSLPGNLMSKLDEVRGDT